MSFAFGLQALQPVAGQPHILGFAAAESTSDQEIVEIWNGPTSAARVLRINKDGQVQVQDGAVGAPAIAPEDDKDTGLYFVSGTPEVAVAVAGSKVLSVVAAGVAVTGTLSATGATSLNGDVTVGNAAGDALTFHPSAWTLSNGVTVTGTWTDLGTVTTVDVNGGTLDGVTIGGASAAAGTFTTVTAARIDPVSGAGIGVNAAALGHVVMLVGGSFTSDGGASSVSALGVTTALTGAAGDTDIFSVNIAPSITTQGQSQTITVAAALRVNEPNITVGSGDTVTNATTVYIQNAPTEASNNYALWVDDGAVRIDGAITGSGGTVGVTIGSGGMVGINETANANMTVGLTINQGAADDEAFAVKASEIGHGATDLADTDTYLWIDKTAAGVGGASVSGIGDSSVSNGMRVKGYAGTVATSKATSSAAPVEVYGALYSGTAIADVSANGNVFAVRVRRGGAEPVVFIVDEDGDFHYDGADGGAFDSEDDVALVRAFALATSKNVIRTEFDDFVKYNAEDLVRLGLLGDLPENGGLVNGAQMQRLLVGAVWQQAQQIEALRSEVKALTA